MNARSAKQKGKLLEDYVADQIVAKGLDNRARRDGASGAGNREKGDICTSLMVLGQNVGIECKNQATLHIPEWWKQAKKMESLSREPVLAFKIYGEPMEETKVVIYLDTFLELIKQANESGDIEPQIPDTNFSREQKYAAESLKTALSRFIKTIEL